MTTSKIIQSVLTGIKPTDRIWRSCFSKTKYETKSSAGYARKRKQRTLNKRKIDRKLRVYCCEFCDGFHLTHRSY